MKKKQHEEPENHERWLVSYADFITLLFAFFTVMYATSSADLDKSKKFEQSVREAFGMLSGEGQDIGVNNFPNHKDKGSIIEPPIKVFYDSSASRDQIKEALLMMIDEKMSEEEREKAGFTVRTDEEGVRITLLASKLFPEGSAKIFKGSFLALDVISGILKLTGRDIVIEGHTDNQPIKSAIYPSNWELAGARAATIVRYFVQRHEFPADKLKVVSYADQRPLKNNDSDENRAINRRIEILIPTP